MVERFRQGEDAISADASPGRLETDGSTCRSGEADRTAGVAAERAVAEPRSGSRTGPAGGCTCPPIGVPGIHGRVELRVVAAHRAFGQVEFAQQHGTGLFEPRYDRTVQVRYVVRQGLTATHRADALREAEVLDCDGDTVKRAAQPSLASLHIRLLRRRDRVVRHDSRIALQPAVESLDPVEHALRRFHRGDVAGSEPFGQLGDCLVRAAIRHLLPPHRLASSSGTSRLPSSPQS